MFSVSEHFQLVPGLWECERAESEHDVWTQPDQRCPWGVLARPQRPLHSWRAGHKGHRHPACQHSRWEPKMLRLNLFSFFGFKVWKFMVTFTTYNLYWLSLIFPLCRCWRFQRVGVFGEPSLLLLLRLLCSQWRHSDPPGSVQPGGAVRDPAQPHHLLAEPPESPHPATGQHRWGEGWLHVFTMIASTDR